MLINQRMRVAAVHRTPWLRLTLHLRLALTSLLLLAIAACGRDTAYPPSPLVTFTPTYQVNILWQSNVGAQAGYFFAPLAINDAIYVASRNGGLTKLDAKNGRKLWTFDAKVPLTVGVAGDSNLLLVGADNGTLIAVDLDGKERWRKSLSSELLSLPNLANGVVVAQSFDSRISGFDAVSGRRLWVVQRNPATLALRDAHSIVSSGSITFVPLNDARLLALSSTNGNQLWENRLSESSGVTELERLTAIIGRPALIGENICLAHYQGDVGCLDALSGNVRWLKPLSSASALVADGEYVIASDERSVVNAYITNTGLNVWKNVNLRDRKVSIPALIDNSVAIGDGAGYVHFLARESGAIQARVQADNSPIKALLSHGRILIVQSEEGQISAYTLQKI